MIYPFGKASFPAACLSVAAFVVSTHGALAQPTSAVPTADAALNVDARKAPADDTDAPRATDASARDAQAGDADAPHATDASARDDQAGDADAPRAPDASAQAAPKDNAPSSAPSDAPSTAVPAASISIVDAPPISVHADSYRANVGEPVTVSVRVTLPLGASLVTATPAKNLFVETVAPTTVDEDRATLRLAVFRPGTYVFHVEVVWIDADGQQHRHLSPALSLQSLSSIANDADPTLAAPGPYVLLRSKNVWLMGLTAGALLALVAAALIVVLRRRFRAVEAPAPAAPAPPAWTIALAAIAQLKADDLLAQEQHLAFHMRLSEILRQWLEGRFGINALEMTTEEISQQLNTRRLDAGPWIDAIEQILADTDVVKFAKFAPPVAGSLQLLDQLEALVEEVRDSDAVGGEVPDPLWDEPEPIADAVHASPQPLAPGEAPVLRASQEPLPDNVIRFSPRSIRKEDDA